MQKVVLFFWSVILIYSIPANAMLPNFQITPELEHCVQHTNDWDVCMKEASQRSLNKIKLQYRQVLSNQNLLKWNENIAQNKQFFFDLYESWTAYRNRQCALEELASQYEGPLVDQKLACTLRMMDIHSSFLDSLTKLLSGTAPKKQTEFTFLRFTHDEDYATCAKNVKTTGLNCLKEEIERTMENIKAKYNEAFKSDLIGAWNNGPDLKNGNYRDLYDSWMAYRNRFCSVAVWAYKQSYGEKAISMNYCLESLNKEQMTNINNVMISAYTILDDDIPDEVLKTMASPEEAGKRITPLERRFEELKGFQKEPLKESGAEEQTDEGATVDVNANTPQQNDENDATPAWARSR